ncbi:lipid-A-disaccharide synthase [Salinisphaera sp.]|uniref:lipid-A-disaccharide synthase n=1 Tax=Salinisphaera sp. TaxID=1914330 RepID=UPI002D7696AD|nr:lipid-A-disaccharide synthase [Salinisphaera sp.]HET7313872.1 lipid-A-disaccharide synthase [Salinisphaera sp.]
MADHAPVFFIVAGEVSGDVLAAGLIRRLAQRYPGARFIGVTGPRMRAAGCESRADIEALSLFGISEVIGQIPRLLRLRRQLYRQVLQLRPDAFIGVDAPAFNTRLEERVRRAGIATVHYVCPTAWAWRAGRTRAIRRAVDLLLAIFPFEPDFFAAHHIRATFVGHPLADELPAHPSAAAAREALGLDPQARWVGLLPGSRGAEVSRLGPRFLEVARWLARRDPAVRFIAPMASARVRARFEADLARFADLDVVLVDGRSREVMRAAEALLIASGTATLEALLAKTPMVVAYELSGTNYWIARGLNLIKTEFVSMPNLLAGRRLVPELLQTDAQVPMLGAWLYRLMHSPAARATQIDAFEAIHQILARDADARAADAVAELIETRQ